tara:strand:+ start:192 stop:389 length:198 start_codon:yes stop_codon:yes gene_type:complete
MGKAPKRIEIDSENKRIVLVSCNTAKVLKVLFQLKQDDISRGQEAVNTMLESAYEYLSMNEDSQS